MVTRGEGLGEGILRGFEINMDMLLYLKWITNMGLYGTGNSAQCYVAVWRGGGLGGEWIPVYGWLSCSAAHLKLSHSCDKYKIKNF